MMTLPVLQYASRTNNRVYRRIIRLSLCLVLLIAFAVPSSEVRLWSQYEARQVFGPSKIRIIYNVLGQVDSVGWPIPWLCRYRWNSKDVWRFQADGVLVIFASIAACVAFDFFLNRWWTSQHAKRADRGDGSVGGLAQIGTARCSCGDEASRQISG